jgi:hypothetical protein
MNVALNNEFILSAVTIRDSSVSMVIGYRLDNKVQFPARGMEGIFSLRHHVQIGSGTHPASCPMDTGGSCPESKATGA